MKNIYVSERKHISPKYVIKDSAIIEVNEIQDITKYLIDNYHKRKINVITDVSKETFEQLKTLEEKLKKVVISKLHQ